MGDPQRIDGAGEDLPPGWRTIDLTIPVPPIVTGPDVEALAAAAADVVRRALADVALPAAPASKLRR